MYLYKRNQKADIQKIQSNEKVTEKKVTSYWENSNKGYNYFFRKVTKLLKKLQVT